MQTSSLLIETDQRGVCTLKLNRPEKHNALDADIIHELLVALKDIDNDPQIRALIITGMGESFCSGADMDWMRASAKFNEADNREDARQFTVLMRSLYDFSKPTIARVNGPAYGGGLGVIACCDIAIASNTAQFAFTEVRLGLVPAVISPYILASIGPRQARRLFLTAERFGAAEALDFQLVHQVAKPNDMDDAVEQQIGYLLKAGPEAIKACKALVPHPSNEQIESELTALIAKLRSSPEGQEGLSAFLAKRKPSWVKD